MAKQDNQEAKKKKKFEDTQKRQMEILEQNAPLSAANYLKGSFGEKGAETADLYLAGPEAAAQKQQLLAQKMAEAKQKGIHYTPEISNYELIENAKNFEIGALQTLTIGNLEKMAKKFSPGLKISAPEDVKEESLITLSEKNKKTKEGEKNPFLEKAGQWYNLITKSYSDGAAIAMMQKSYLDRSNQIGESLNKMYSQAA